MLVVDIVLVTLEFEECFIWEGLHTSTSPDTTMSRASSYLPLGLTRARPKLAGDGGSVHTIGQPETIPNEVSTERTTKGREQVYKPGGWHTAPKIGKGSSNA